MILTVVLSVADLKRWKQSTENVSLWCKSCETPFLESCADAGHTPWSKGTLRRNQQSAELLQRLDEATVKIQRKIQSLRDMSDDKFAKIHEMFQKYFETRCMIEEEHLVTVEEARKNVNAALRDAGDEEWKRVVQKAETIAQVYEGCFNEEDEEDEEDEQHRPVHDVSLEDFCDLGRVDRESRKRFFHETDWKKVKSLTGVSARHFPAFVECVLRKTTRLESLSVHGVRGGLLSDIKNLRSLRTLSISLNCCGGWTDYISIVRMPHPYHPTCIPCLPAGLEELVLISPCRLELLSLNALPRLRRLTLASWHGSGFGYGVFQSDLPPHHVGLEYLSIELSEKPLHEIKHLAPAFVREEWRGPSQLKAARSLILLHQRTLVELKIISGSSHLHAWLLTLARELTFSSLRRIDICFGCLHSCSECLAFRAEMQRELSISSSVVVSCNICSELETEFRSEVKHIFGALLASVFLLVICIVWLCILNFVEPVCPGTTGAHGPAPPGIKLSLWERLFLIFM